METISKLDVTIINIIVDTTNIKHIASNNIYNFFSGYLYERICWFMIDHKGKANINISSRGNLSKKSLSEFINSRNHKKFEIDASRIKTIKIIPNERKKLLQLADCCCSALFQSLKYNNKTHFEYINIIKEKLYSNNGKIMSYGIKLVPGNVIVNEITNLLNYLNN